MRCLKMFHNLMIIIIKYLTSKHQYIYISMVDNTMVLCPLFDKTEILIPGDSPSILPSLDKMQNFNS